MKSQVVPEQLAAALAGVTQVAHVPPHSRAPALHVKLQLVPLQVATPFWLPGHTVQLEPHEAMSELARHWLPHR